MLCKDGLMELADRAQGAGAGEGDTDAEGAQSTRAGSVEAEILHQCGGCIWEWDLCALLPP